MTTSSRVPGARRAYVLFASMILAVPSSAGAQSATPAVHHSVLAGYVRDELGHPVTLATLMVDGTRLSTTTNDSGYFRLTDAPSGTDVFTAMRIGYAPVTFEILMPPDSAVYTEILLRAVVNVAKMTVTDKATPVGLMRVGFIERQHLGLGQFITPEMIAGMPMATSAASLLRQTPGLDVRCPRRVGGGCSVSAGRGECLSLWIDGTYNSIGGEGLDDAIGIDAVWAIEVYPRANQVPSRFQRSRASTACGAIVVWTKLKSR